MGKYKKLLGRLKDLERAVLIASNQEKIKCSECSKQKYRAEFHDREFKKTEGFVCKICRDRKRNMN